MDFSLFEEFVEDTWEVGGVFLSFEEFAEDTFCGVVRGLGCFCDWVEFFVFLSFHEFQSKS